MIFEKRTNRIFSLSFEADFSNEKFLLTFVSTNDRTEQQGKIEKTFLPFCPSFFVVVFFFFFSRTMMATAHDIVRLYHQSRLSHWGKHRFRRKNKSSSTTKRALPCSYHRLSLRALFPFPFAFLFLAESSFIIILMGKTRVFILI